MKLYIVLFTFILISGTVCLGQGHSPKPDQVLAYVNSKPIVASDANAGFFLDQVSKVKSAKMTHEELIHLLVERRLIESFLAKRKVVADPIRLEQQMSAIRKLIEKKKEDYSTVLSKAGLDDESLREMLALQIAWRMHVTNTLTESRIAEFWKEHKEKFDGTTVTASQVFIRLSNDTDDSATQSRRAELDSLRDSIMTREVSFAEAAKKHSESPSSQQGGSLGTFEYHGHVAEPIAKVAFRLKAGEVSEPFQTSFGLHLVKVNDRAPGDLSLEDARPQVVKELSRVLWNEQVAREKTQAKIEIVKGK